MTFAATLGKYLMIMAASTKMFYVAFDWKQQPVI